MMGTINRRRRVQSKPPARAKGQRARRAVATCQAYILGLDRSARAGSGRPHAARSTDVRSTARPRAPARPVTAPLTAPPRAPNRPPAARSRSAGQGARYYPFRGLLSQPPRSTDPALPPLDRPLHGRDPPPSPSPSPRSGVRDLSGGKVDRTVCSITVGQRAEGASPTLGTWRNTTQWERSMVTRVRSGTGSNSAAILSGVASRWAVAGCSWSPSQQSYSASASSASCITAVRYSARQRRD